MADPADGRVGAGRTVDHVPRGLFLRTRAQFCGRRRHESASGLGHGPTDGIVGLSPAVGGLLVDTYIPTRRSFTFTFFSVRHMLH